jgi:cytochrome c peroxidase
VACHVTPRFTSPESYDVGMVDEKGNREFNPPSLRGVSQRRPFFHDNRASTLEDVFLKHRHQLDEALDDEERVALLAFLRSL